MNRLSIFNPIVILALVAIAANWVPSTAQADELSVSQAQAQTPPTQNVKYKKAKDVDFDALLIQGQLKRPELTVVTGDASQGTDGLLRLRENFLDQTQNDIGEEIQP